MTRRERLERKLEKRRAWAEAREREAAQRFDRAHAATAGIPMGQPILVGHHSEKRHRAALARSDSNMRAGCEAQDMAAHHESAANGIERQLETAIYSDDPDAVEALEAKLAGLLVEQERDKAINKAVRKALKNPDGEARILALAAELAPLFPDCQDAEKLRRLAAAFLTPDPCHGCGIPSYVGQNRNGNIGRIRKRIEFVKAQKQRAAVAEASENGIVIEGTEYVRITFADKPARQVLDALKAANFRWSQGSWYGYRAAIPAGVQAGD